MGEIAIKVENLTKEYRLGTIGHGTLREDLQTVWARFRGKEDPNSIVTTQHNIESDIKHFLALDDISFDIKKGDRVGIIGKNGAGKSTLLKILSRITSPTKGNIYVDGRIGSLLEVGTGFHPELTGRENIYLNGAIMGMKKWEIFKKLDEIVDFSGVERFIDTPVKRYSSGMRIRLGFSVAAHLDTEILIIDEVLAVGDANFQKKAIDKMEDVSSKKGKTIVFVSHNMYNVKRLCSKGVYLKSGRSSEIEDIDLIYDQYISDSLISIRSNKPLGIGTRQIVIDDFWIENFESIQIKKLISGEKNYLVFKLLINEPIEKIEIGFSLFDMDGNLLTAYLSSYENIFFDFSKYKSGTFVNVKFLFDYINFGKEKMIIKPTIQINKINIDTYFEAFSEIHVIQSNFFGTGSEGYRIKTPLLVKGQWEISNS